MEETCSANMTEYSQKRTLIPESTIKAATPTVSPNQNILTESYLFNQELEWSYHGGNGNGHDDTKEEIT